MGRSRAISLLRSLAEKGLVVLFGLIAALVWAADKLKKLESDTVDERGDSR